MPTQHSGYPPFKPYIPKPWMTCWRTEDDWRAIRPENKSLVKRSIKNEKKMMFRMSKYEALSGLIGIDPNPFYLISYEKSTIDCYVHDNENFSQANKTFVSLFVRLV